MNVKVYLVHLGVLMPKSIVIEFGMHVDII